MPLYQFICESGHEGERIVPLGTEEVSCFCGQVAQRIPTFGASIVTVRAAVPPDQQRHNLALFREATAERAYVHQKAEEHFERPIASRNLWLEAKRRAKQVRLGNAPPPSNTR